jgi:enamine deaminase RidA (YjgF/YER057c/UK114 family)
MKKTFSGAPWEKQVGYCRALRVGNLIEVSGTTAMGSDNQVIGVNDIATQTKNIIETAEKSLQELGASLTHVIRTRMYTTNIALWEEIGAVHGQYFEEIQPTTKLVEVSKLIHPDLLIEIEFTAHLDV